MVRQLPPGHDIKDLYQEGVIGLMQATRSYEHVEGAQFKTFAVARIRGSILDYLRSGDPVPRSIRKKMRLGEKQAAMLEQSLGRPATEAEVAAALGVSLGEYQETLFDSCIVFCPAEPRDKDGQPEPFLESTELGPLSSLLKKETIEELTDGVDSLPSNWRLALLAYYRDDETQLQIAKQLGVTESRVCQLLHAARERLREIMERKGYGNAY